MSFNFRITYTSKNLSTSEQLKRESILLNKSRIGFRHTGLSIGSKMLPHLRLLLNVRQPTIGLATPESIYLNRTGLRNTSPFNCSTSSVIVALMRKD